ncbi:MAG: serine hydroxymethyltransferase [Dehalococcoidia bacterium]|nr:serine hydroxymethyltransferase [Dehalococcoidia bacterium]
MLERHDSEVARILEQEAERQENTITLIASENHVHPSIIEAQSCLMTDKYAEGYPGRRYYGGCANIDTVETLAIERAKELFKAEHANVQPHSGSQANMATYSALLGFGDAVMGLSLSHGGHLTHGSKVNFSGKWYNFIPYGVNARTEMLDYDEIEELALRNRPKLIVAGASAYPRTIDFKRFRDIADKVDAGLVADIAHISGLVAAGLHPSPVPHVDVVTSTTQKTLRGPRGGFILCKKELAPAIDAAVFPRMQGGPAMHVIAAKAVCFFNAMQPEFVEYQRSVLKNARVLALELQKYGMRIVSGGTDNHMVLVDISPLGISGREAEEALEASGILANRNTIPFDPKPPRIASGIRLGTPAITTRGFGTGEVIEIASFISQVLSNPQDEKLRERIRHEVKEMCRHFPVPALK